MESAVNRILLPVASVFCACAMAHADTNIDPAHKFAWQENVGWTNWSDANAGVDGVQVLDDHLAGFIWCENIGYVNVGPGGGPYAPAASQTGADFGVNIAPGGDLSGFAWGENVGWINFDTSSLGASRARFDANDQRFYGYAWGENIGWLNLDDAARFVATLASCAADLDGNGAVGSGDLAILLAAWSTSGGASDLDGSGTVGSGDLAVLLAAWGPCD